MRFDRVQLEKKRGGQINRASRTAAAAAAARRATPRHRARSHATHSTHAAGASCVRCARLRPGSVRVSAQQQPAAAAAAAAATTAVSLAAVAAASPMSDAPKMRTSTGKAWPTWRGGGQHGAVHAQSTGNARSHRHRTDRTTTARTRVTNDGSGVAGAFRVGQRFAREHECRTAARGGADRALRQRVSPPQRTATLRRGAR